MLLLNFSHPLTEAQYVRIVALAVDSVGLSSEGWQVRPLLINPPGYALAASALPAELRVCTDPKLTRGTQ